MRPLCFSTDDEIASMVNEVIGRLPALRTRQVDFPEYGDD
jgi:hypothetical protein